MPVGVYKRTKFHREAISKALKGKRPKNLDWLHKNFSSLPKPIGENAYHWKGDAVGYHGVHIWIRKTLGKPRKCDRCGSINAKRYEWSNISRKYKRDISDWERLCVSCHRKKGFANGEYYIPWKGKKVYMNTGRTWIKKGQHLSPKTEFKKFVKET